MVSRQVRVEADEAVIRELSPELLGDYLNSFSYTPLTLPTTPYVKDLRTMSSF